MENISHSSAQEAARMAAELGLPEDSTWADINVRSAQRHIGRTALQ